MRSEPLSGFDDEGQLMIDYKHSTLETDCIPTKIGHPSTASGDNKNLFSKFGH